MKKVEIPTVKPALKKAILDAIGLAYTSVSGKDNIETGNHYQSLILGDERTVGFRSGREGFLDQIDFRRKRVLDLGANLGEISRAARALGAELVDGYESDPFFVELAQAINAYNGTTGVSFYERDITDPDSYRERYDIILALSVFTYVRPVLHRLAEMTNEALVIETHKLDGNLERDYLGPVAQFLPVYRVLGESEWGRALPEGEKRAVIVFARDEPALKSALSRATVSRLRPTRINAQRTKLHQRFFDEVHFANGDDLLADVRGMKIDLARVADDPDLAKLVYSGKTYWLLFLKGYCQYLASRVLGPGNIYYEYITGYYAPRQHDPGISDALADPLFALERVAARFRDADRFRQAPLAYVPAPVRIFRSGDPNADRLELYDADSDEILHASAVDGWHRLFAARVFGAATVPAEVVETPAK
jgi:SAM-dependent methyltransferase